MLALAALVLLAPASFGVNVEVVNDSGRPAQEVWLTLHDGSSSDGKLVADEPKRLSEVAGSHFEIGAIAAGRLFVSYGKGVGPAEPPEASTRYDKIEFTNPGVANLTSVDFFAIPFALESLEASGARVGDQLAFRCYTSTLLPRLRALAPAAEVTSEGQFVRFLSPQLSPSSYPSMEPYVLSMVGQTITVADEFDKTPVDFTGTFEAGGSITLTGTVGGGSGEAVHVEGATLPLAIYTGNGEFTVGGKKADVSENNAYSVVYRDLVAGFALGYWGGKYGNDSANWLGQPDFAKARPGGEPYATYDQYAALIGEYSNAYAYSFNDVGPTPVAIPLTGSVATLRLTIEPDEGPAACVTTPSSPVSTTSSTSPILTGPFAPLFRRPAVAIASSSARLNRAGRAPVTLRCVAGALLCTGELTFTYTLPPAKPKHARAAARRKAKPKPKPRTVAFGAIAFVVPGGASRVVSVPVPPAARRLLAAARGKRLVVQASATLGPRAKPTFATRRALTLLAYAPPRKRTKRRAR